MTKNTRTLFYVGGAGALIAAGYQWYRWNVVKVGDTVAVRFPGPPALGLQDVIEPAKVTSVQGDEIGITSTQGPQLSGTVKREQIVRIIAPA